MRESNLDLALLLAYQLAQNWHGHITLCMAVPDADTRQKAETFLTKLISLARLPQNTGIYVAVAPFAEALEQVPPADLTIFGLSHQPDMVFVHGLAQKLNSSCVFVRDSGAESILA